MILSSILKSFQKSPYIGVKTFTYFLPAPPSRKTGYQEKEFDAIFQYLMNKDFDLIEFKLESVSNDKTSGMWIVCLLGAKTEKAMHEHLHIEYSEIVKGSPQKIQMDPDIEHDTN